MFKKTVYTVSDGKFVQAVEREGLTVIHTREDGRIVARKMTDGGKIFGMRVVSYADAYFDFPCGTAEIFGEEITYAAKTGVDS